MIDLINLKNFQIHKAIELKFTYGINVITGKSDSGKTAIIRALYYLCFNLPASNNYISNWSDFTEISIVKNKHKIVRLKSDAKNSYYLDDQEFSAIGRNVPDEIIKCLNLTDINFQRQLDRHFLLSETPGNIAKFFNNLVKINDIDYYLQGIDSKKRNITRDLKTKKQQLESIEKELETYNWIEKAEPLYSKVYSIEEELKSLSQRLETVSRAVIAIKRIQKELDDLKDYTTAQNLLDKIEKYQEKINSNQTKALYNIIDKINSLNTIIKANNKKLSELEDSMPEICPICGGKL